MSNLPDFLLIGPGRTGTTWVTKNLMLHPQIFMPRIKSTRFFLDNYEQGLDWYKSYFDTQKESLSGEASVGYFANSEAANRIKQHVPNVKMIATFRDPVDRAYSELGLIRSFAKKGDKNKNIDFEEKLKVTPRIVEQGLYATHLQRFYSLFPEENVLILFYEDMKASPVEFLRRIYSFLGVDTSFESPLIEQRINSSATRLAESGTMKFLYRVLLRLNLFRLSNRIDSSMQKPVVPLPPAVKMRIMNQYYLKEIEQLEKLLNVDLSRWKSVGETSQFQSKP